LRNRHVAGERGRAAPIDDAAAADDDVVHGSRSLVEKAERGEQYSDEEALVTAG